MAHTPNPWLNDYNQQGTVQGASTQNQATAASITASHLSGQRGKKEGRRLGYALRKPRYLSRYLMFGIIITVVGAVAAGLTGPIGVVVARFLDSKLNPKTEIALPAIPVVAGTELFAVRIQVRSSLAEGRSYVRDNYPLASMAFEYWNSPPGLFLHMGVDRDTLRAFIPEPRPGKEKEFADLIFQGIKEVQFHVFPYQSEAQLYRLADKCGLPSGGAEWIKIWSTWREGDERREATKCVQGGICLMLTRGCTADAFAYDEATPDLRSSITKGV